MYCEKICNPVDNIDFNFHALLCQINTTGYYRQKVETTLKETPSENHHPVRWKISVNMSPQVR